MSGLLSKRVRGTSSNVAPSKPQMSGEGTTGKQTSMVERVLEREGMVYLSRGVPGYLVNGEWHRVPNELWAWSPRRTTCWCCQTVSFRNHCWHGSRTLTEYEPMQWTLKLLRAAEVQQLQLALGALEPLPIPSDSRLSGVRDVATTAEQLPPELFKQIYGWADGKLARKCRLVCRYWEKQCRSAAFRVINVESERLVSGLTHIFNRDPAWQHIPPLVGTIRLPIFTAKTKALWMHLLDPHWKRGGLVITGPFPGRRTLRSIHIGLPRSLPRSFSRRFTQVCLSRVHFGRFEDTTCLASELLDLERLFFEEVTWDSLPTEVPRRRPRADRNKLSDVWFKNCSVTGVESPSFAFAVWTLVLGVSRPSPFDSLGFTQALVRAVHQKECTIMLERDCDGYVSGLKVDDTRLKEPTNTSLLLRHRLDALTAKHILFVFLKPAYINKRLPPWSQLNSTIARLPQSWHLHFLFGYDSQQDMLHFAADIVEKQLTSLVGRGEVRFTVDLYRHGRWYEASPEFDGLKGRGAYDPIDVYADWQKMFKPPCGTRHSPT